MSYLRLPILAVPMLSTLNSIGLLLAALLLAVAPGIAIAVFVYFRDKYEREPHHLLVKCFLFGGLSILPALLIEGLVEASGFERYQSLASTALYAFVFVGFVEELSKFVALRFYAYRQDDFNEPFDGITYSVMIAMGFATFENLFYVFDGGAADGIRIALVRMLTAVPAHAANAVLMGYYLGLAKFQNRSRSLQFTALMVAAVAHGSYDLFIFLDNMTLIIVGAGIVLGSSTFLAFRAMKAHQINSPFYHN